MEVVVNVEVVEVVDELAVTCNILSHLVMKVEVTHRYKSLILT